MSNLEIIHKKVLQGETVYIFDDFERAALKIFPDGRVYIKRKGSPETRIDRAAKSVFDIELGGEIVDAHFYERFGLTDELTAEMHAEFGVDALTEIKHKVWDAMKSSDDIKEIETILKTWGVAFIEFEKWKNTYPTKHKLKS